MKLKHLVILLTLWIMSALSLAQADTWSAYLFNSSTNALLRVYADGSTQNYPLGLPEGAQTNGRDLTFSPDGTIVAFCAMTYTAEAIPQSALLIVRDLINGQNLVERDLGLPSACRVGDAGFNANVSRVTLSVIYYFLGDPNVDSELPAWALLVIDTNTGEVLEELNADSTIATPINEVGFGALMPDVRVHTDESILFTVQPWFTGGAPEVPAYQWDLTNDTISTVDYWGNTSGVYLPDTGEFVFTSLNPDLPAANPGGPLPQTNTVNIVNADGNVYPIYVNSDEIVVSMAFIKDGQALALQLLGNFDPEQAENPQTLRWVALGRDGSLEEMIPNTLNFISVENAPAGFVSLNTAFDMETYGSSYTLEWVSDGVTTPLWSTEVAENGGFWDLIWTTPLSSIEVTPFTVAP
ncbi:MAG: hypothetical protein MUF87_07630 [Anaerolineae bacterium]|jgi:hypothetical protein|nr:hypothetical protein [Anaerolineae bacterium]